MVMSPSFLSGLGREDAEQGDDEGDAQIGLEVSVRLVTARGRDGLRGKGGGGRLLDVDTARDHRRQNVSGWVALRAWTGRAQERMRVPRNLTGGERDGLHAARLGQRESV